MQTHFIEATNQSAGGFNWGKFMLGRFDEHEIAYVSTIDNKPLIAGRGITAKRDLLVLDLQTGEGCIFTPGGLATADLNKHKIWVCPMFAPMLEWLYQQDLTDISKLPPSVDLSAEGDFRGYRRTGEG